ncbi:MAG TPA: ABC transporter ATP-binding protein [Acidimicrobiales bacterium]|nr:ABC transporter ATP-binding protein [Acidimicrobiales bacterium]
MADPVALRLQNLTKRFPGASVDAVSDLSLALEEGTLTALVGPSGCGKTTTLRMINRLEEPTSGRIELFGRDVRDQPLHELRRGIGYVIQHAGLFPHRTVAANIATVPKLLGWDKARIAARVDELVDLVGLDPSILKRYPAALSGGQQQRVGVARALAADPPVLLMDEPYSAVDPIVRTRLQEELIALQRRVRKTIVFVTHDIDEAIKLADNVALMRVGGELAQFGPPDELLRAPASPFAESFLGNERALRRLALRLVSDVQLQPLPDARGGLPTVAQSSPLREALDALVAQGVSTVIVTDAAGAPVGALDVVAIAAGLHRSAPE